jgi:hypothetical protein
MRIVDALRNRVAGSDSEASEGGPPDSFPIDRYDRLDAKTISLKLSSLTQEQLAVVEDRERAHENRAPVLDKLRYLREAEPLEGYDRLDSGAVKQALRGSDPATVRSVRDYERKFAHRPEVLAETARLLAPAGS